MRHTSILNRSSNKNEAVLSDSRNAERNKRGAEQLCRSAESVTNLFCRDGGRPSSVPPSDEGGGKNL